MKCKCCGGEQFVAHQEVRMEILVDGNGSYKAGIHKDISYDIYDSGNPYGPFQCCGCGAEYEELADGEEPICGPVEDWHWEKEE